MAAATILAGGGAVALTAPYGGAAEGDQPATYAPLRNAPPAYSQAPAALAAALKCPPSLAGNRTPVLLIAGTGVTPEQNFDWNWKIALAKRGIPQCTIALPYQGLGDIQVAGEYVAYAIRTMYGAAGRKISIVGHSQGGMVPRWALRFWGDTRAMVDDVIGLAPSNHGTPAGDATMSSCRSSGCPAAYAQLAAGSRFLEALNSRFEAFDGISYTNIRTKTDEILDPGGVPTAQASTSLTSPQGRITNVAIQDVCPADQSGHRLVGTISNTAFELAMDALTHDGPADPGRAKAAACATTLMPGVDPNGLQGNFSRLGAMSDAAKAAVPIVREEPALKAYVGGRFDVEPPDAAIVTPPLERAQLTIQPTRLTAGRRVTLRIRVTSSNGRALSRQRVRVLGRSTRTGRDGRVRLKLRPKKAGKTVAQTSGNGLPVAKATIRVVHAPKKRS
ncbi:lipase [Patulibacter sp. NPDC049589]|uniref:esterase/lipase family protein n=1 Tax=Patulibacter sp. NPDC049589 TaxID=3154731 RepID=UPI0034184ABF